MAAKYKGKSVKMGGHGFGKAAAKLHVRPKAGKPHNASVDYGNQGVSSPEDQTSMGLPHDAIGQHERSVPHKNVPEMYMPNATHALDGLIQEHLHQAAKHEALGASGRMKADEHRAMARELRANHPLYGPKAHKGPTEAL